MSSEVSSASGTTSGVSDVHSTNERVIAAAAGDSDIVSGWETAMKMPGDNVAKLHAKLKAIAGLSRNGMAAANLASGERAVIGDLDVIRQELLDTRIAVEEMREEFSRRMQTMEKDGSVKDALMLDLQDARRAIEDELQELKSRHSGEGHGEERGTMGWETASSGVPSTGSSGSAPFFVPHVLPPADTPPLPDPGVSGLTAEQKSKFSLPLSTPKVSLLAGTLAELDTTSVQTLVEAIEEKMKATGMLPSPQAVMLFITPKVLESLGLTSASTTHAILVALRNYMSTYGKSLKENLARLPLLNFVGMEEVEKMQKELDAWFRLVDVEISLSSTLTKTDISVSRVVAQALMPRLPGHLARTVKDTMRLGEEGFLPTGTTYSLLKAQILASFDGLTVTGSNFVTNMRLLAAPRVVAPAVKPSIPPPPANRGPFRPPSTQGNQGNGNNGGKQGYGGQGNGGQSGGGGGQGHGAGTAKTGVCHDDAKPGGCTRPVCMFTHAIPQGARDWQRKANAPGNKGNDKKGI